MKGNEPKFTKGEWVVIDKDPHIFEKDPVNNLVKMPSSQKTKYGACFYASIGGFDIHTQKEEAEANARLIAAAPEMYKLLEDLSEINVPIDYLEESEFNALCKIDELLAKARGVHADEN